MVVLLWGLWLLLGCDNYSLACSQEMQRKSFESFHREYSHHPPAQEFYVFISTFCRQSLQTFTYLSVGVRKWLESHQVYKLWIYMHDFLFDPTETDINIQSI